MVIPFAVLFISIGYLCYKAKNEVYITEEDESLNEKEDINRGLDDLFI